MIYISFLADKIRISKAELISIFEFIYTVY